MIFGFIRCFFAAGLSIISRNHQKTQLQIVPKAMNFFRALVEAILSLHLKVLRHVFLGGGKDQRWP